MTYGTSPVSVKCIRIIQWDKSTRELRIQAFNPTTDRWENAWIETDMDTTANVWQTISMAYETDAPTGYPTAPTNSPSKAPSNSPTANPSKAPTQSPSTSPSKQPSSSPTANPSKAPTTSPTSQVRWDICKIILNFL